MSELTVVIPAFNARPTIERAIASALETSPSRVVVVDDGSTDDTATIARARGAQVIRQENAGASVARRSGFSVCTSEYVIFLDADDELVHDGVRSSLDVLEQDASAVAAVARTLAVDGRGNHVAMRPWPEGVSLSSLVARGHSPGPPGAITWRSSAISRGATIPPPPLDLRYADDYELLLRVAPLGMILQHAHVGCQYAVEGGKSSLSPASSMAAAEQLRAHYAAAAGIPYRKLGRLGMKSAVARRNAMSARASGRRSLAVAQLVLAMLCNPRWAAAGLRRRLPQHP